MSETAAPIEIQLLPAAVSVDAGLVQRIADLINEVYEVAEAGLWTDGATRTTVAEVADLTRAGEIAVARLHGRIVGCVRVQRLDESTGEFGMLAADPAHRGRGIGRELLRFAERRCRADGLGAIQLELLVPRDWTHPTKEFLDAWYTRLGYRVTRTGRIDEAYPALGPLLATPCDFVIYRKDLQATLRPGIDARAADRGLPARRWQCRTLMYNIAVSFDVQPERREDFIAAALEDGRNSGADEPGTQRFELIADEENPNRFYLNEAYDDAEAFDAHANGPHFARFFELVEDYVEGPTWLIKGTRIEDHATRP